MYNCYGICTVCGFVNCKDCHFLEKGGYENYFISYSNNKDQNGFSNTRKVFLSVWFVGGGYRQWNIHLITCRLSVKFFYV